jgi:hypothetical protein
MGTRGSRAASILLSVVGASAAGAQTLQGAAGGTGEWPTYGRE